MAAFENVYGIFGKGMIGICVLLFAFSTMVGWEIEFETSFIYIFGEKTKMFARILYLIPPFLTLCKTTEMIWTIVDIAVGIVVLPNIIALLMLSKVFIELMNDFEKNKMEPELLKKRNKK